MSCCRFLKTIFSFLLISVSSFGAFEELKKYAVDEHGQLNSKTRLLCGLGAGVC